MSKLKLSKAELIFYIVSGLLILTGIVFAIIGIIGDNLAPDNDIQKAQRYFMPFRYFGVILLAAGSILITFSFLFFARDAEKRAEREERRKQRLELADKVDKEVAEQTATTEGEVKDIESTPVEEKAEPEQEKDPVEENK